MNRVVMTDQLLKHPLIAYLSDEVKHRVSQNIELHSYKADTSVYMQQSQVECVYVLLLGDVERTRYLPNGDKSVINRLTDNQVMSDVVFGKYHAMTAMTTKPSVIAKLPLAWFESNGLLSSTSHAWLAQQMEEQLVQQFYETDLLCLKGAEARLCYFLKLHAGTDNVVKLPFTFRVMAEKLHLRHETLSRQIKKLVDDNIIYVHKKSITILQPDYLACVD